MNWLARFVDRHVITLLCVSLITLLITGFSAAIAAYDWLWLNSAKARCAPHAFEVFGFWFFYLTMLALVIFIAVIAGKWADRQYTRLKSRVARGAS